MIELLKTQYPEKAYKYYSMAVMENYDRPCFFTQLLPVDMQPENYNSRKNIVAFYVTVMLRQTDEAKILDMIQEIRDLLGLSVMIGKQSVNVTDFDWSYTGSDRNIPVISVSLEWLDKVIHKNDAPIAEQVITNAEMEG